jgi:hypothetical protein
MKPLKSSYHDLHRIFEQSITVREIAEPLSSFDESQPAGKAKKFMEARDFDVVGVRSEGTIIGYVQREDLRSGVVGEFVTAFDDDLVLHESDPLLTALEAMKNQRWVFVRFLGNPSGIITRGDLQKAPMRMWLFGLLSLLEMQLLAWIREVHPEDGWRSHLNPDRLTEAESLMEKRRTRNEAIDLASCLQLADKKMIFAKSDLLFEMLAPYSKRAWEKLMRDVENLRNNLAHSNDLESEEWPRIADIVEEVEALLKKMEGGEFGTPCKETKS